MFLNNTKLTINCLQPKPSFENQNPTSCESRKLILEQRYPLNKSLSKWVSVGIDPKELSTVVQIYNAAIRGPKFNIQEWNEFLSLENSIISFCNDKTDFQVYKMNNHEINTVITEYQNIKMISIACDNSELYLGVKSCFNLFSMKELIASYIKILYSLNFCNVYNGILSKAIDLDADLFTNIKRCLNMEKMEHFGIQEMIYLYPMIVSENYKSLMFFNFQQFIGSENISSS